MTNDEVARRPNGDLLAAPQAVEREIAAGRSANRVMGLLGEALSASGVSQREIAEALEVTEGRVSQVLSGDGNVYVSTLARYLRAMGYQLELGATACVDALPEIGIRRARRRARERRPDYYDAYMGRVTYNGTEFKQIVFMDGDVPLDATQVLSPKFVARVDARSTASLRIVSMTGEIPVVSRDKLASQ